MNMGGHDKTNTQRKKPRRADPTDWGEWEYWDIYNQEVRSRINEQGGEEYEYRPAQTADVPRTTSSGTEFAAHDDTAGEDILGYGYRELSPIENMTHNLSRSTLLSVPPTPIEYEGTFQAGNLPSISLPRYNAPFQLSPGLAAGSSVSTSSQPSSIHQPQGYGTEGAVVYSTDLSPLPERGNQSVVRSNPGVERGQPGNDGLADPGGAWDTFDPGQFMSVNAAQQPQVPNSNVSYAMTSQPANITHQTQANPRPAVTFLPSTPNPSAPGNNTSQNQTSRANSSNRSGVRVIRPSNTNADVVSSDLAREFKICESKRFKRGYVFKVVWIEPKGQGQRPNSNREYASISNAKYGEEAYASIRRFVIVSSYEGHSLCLPILTYGNQGTRKSGVKPYHHAIIYTSPPSSNSTTPPLEVPGEAPLSNPPIYVERTEPRHLLDVASRINYAKVYTIEHNVRVVFIGRIHKDWQHQFFATYNRILKGEVLTHLSDSENDKFEGGNGKGKDKSDTGGGGVGDVHKSNQNYRY